MVQTNARRLAHGGWHSGWQDHVLQGGTDHVLGQDHVFHATWKTMCSMEAQTMEAQIWRMAWRMAQKRANHVLVKRSSEQHHSSRFDP